MVKGIFIIITIVCLVYFILLVLMQGSHNLPPENHSATSMYGLETSIIRFARINNQLPINLEELSSLEGFANGTKDAWGNPFEMKFDNYSITLISYGKDREQGGIGDNKDVIGVFKIKTGDGKWVKEEDYNWLKQPLESW